MSISKNAAFCFHCETEIESTNRHHMQRCKCASDDDAIWVDGGCSYLRRMWGQNALMEDRSVVSGEEND